MFNSIAHNMVHVYFMYSVNILYVQCVCMLMMVYSMCKGSIVHSIGTTVIDSP